MTTGAGPIGPLSEDWPSVRTYADRISYYAEALNNDAKNQIVYDDSAKLADMIAKAKTGGTIGTLTLPILEKAYAEAQAKVVARGGDAQAAKDLDWANRWKVWLGEWRVWNENVHSISPGVSAQQAWQIEQAKEVQLRQYASDFLALGGTHLSAPIPAILVTPDAKPDTGITDSIPWGTIMVIGGLVAGASLLNAVKR